jgi:hypothetical protein
VGLETARKREKTQRICDIFALQVPAISENTELLTAGQYAALQRTVVSWHGYRRDGRRRRPRTDQGR